MQEYLSWLYLWKMGVMGVTFGTIRLAKAGWQLTCNYACGLSRHEKVLARRKNNRQVIQSSFMHTVYQKNGDSHFASFLPRIASFKHNIPGHSLEPLIAIIMGFPYKFQNSEFVSISKFCNFDHLKQHRNIYLSQYTYHYE